MLFFLAVFLNLAKADSFRIYGNDYGSVLISQGAIMIMYEIPSGITIYVGNNVIKDFYVVDARNYPAIFSVSNSNPNTVYLNYYVYAVDYPCNVLRLIANPRFDHSITISNSGGDYALNDSENICLLYANTDIRVDNDLTGDDRVLYKLSGDNKNYLNLGKNRYTFINGDGIVLVQTASGDHSGLVTVRVTNTKGGTYIDNINGGKIYTTGPDDMINPFPDIAPGLALWVIIVIVIVVFYAGTA